MYTGRRGAERRFGKFLGSRRGLSYQRWPSYDERPPLSDGRDHLRGLRLSTESACVTARQIATYGVHLPPVCGGRYDTDVFQAVSGKAFLPFVPTCVGGARAEEEAV